METNTRQGYEYTLRKYLLPTALNDQVIYFHPCAGVSTPTAPKRRTQPRSAVRPRP